MDRTVVSPNGRNQTVSSKERARPENEGDRRLSDRASVA